jgi:hypothetical protein
MRNDFGTRWTPPRFKGSSARVKKSGGGKAQGYIDKKDESIGMRLGKGKATKENPKAAKKERDLSSGKWGRRGRDWKKA